MEPRGDGRAFVEKLLALLDTGSFATSHKYALLLALFDRSRGHRGGRVSTRT